MVDFAVDAVHRRIGVPVEATLIPGGEPSLALVPSGVHQHDSFAVRFSPGWRAAMAEFVPGKFAAPLIPLMGKADSGSRSTFAAFADALKARRTHLSFRVNGTDISPFNTTDWPDNWIQVSLQARSARQVIEPNDIAQMRQLILDLVIPVFGMVVALIGIEEDERPVEGVSEGMPTQVIATRYERKMVNREACIQLKGLRCAACGFDFSDFYGPLGVGYVEIHHTIPISRIGPDYRINVSTDLEPLCANCHAMVHRENPPIPVPVLAGLISHRREG